MSGYLGFGDELDPPGIGRSSPANHKPFDLELIGLSAGEEVGDVGKWWGSIRRAMRTGGLVPEVADGYYTETGE